RALADSSRTVRLPVHFVEQLNRIKAARASLSVDLDRPPTLAEIAALLACDPAEVGATLNTEIIPFSLGLPVPDGHGGFETLGEQLVCQEDPSPLTHVLHGLRRDALYEVLDSLTEKEATILAMRSGLADGEPKTLDEIGKCFGVTRERIRQIEKKAFAQLQDNEALQAQRSFYFDE
ncbi:MAG: hypothetical protein M3021_05400, partial [Actinomycetota bacterium]|nr:hypothetical protein [Actinomycetota bacterium]